MVCFTVAKELKKVICIPLEFRALENHVFFKVFHLNLYILLQTSLTKIRRCRVIKKLGIPHTPVQHRGIFLREEFVTYTWKWTQCTVSIFFISEQPINVVV